MKTGRSGWRRTRGFVGVLLLGGMSGCADSGDAERARDGVIDNDLLQVVVEAGIDRDAQALRGFLEHRDPAVRARALFQLASMPGAVAKSEIIARLDDDDARVRSDAAFALGRSADTVGTSDLVRRLEEESDAGVRLALIETVGSTGGRGAAALLLRADVRAGESAHVALALARLGHRGVNNALAVERLVEFLGSEDAETRRNAAYYFGRSSNPAFWAPVASRLRDHLDALGPEDEAAAWLMLALALIGDPADTERIVTRLGSALDWRTRYVAAAALRPRQQLAGVTTALFAALSDDSPHVRTTAANALAQAAQWDSDHVDFVRVWIEEHVDDWRTGGVLLGGLVRQGGRGEVDVRAWLNRYPPDSHARASGLRALLQMPGEWPSTTLLAETAGEGATAAAALETLAERLPTESSEWVPSYFDGLSAAAASGDPMKVSLATGLLADTLFRDMGARSVMESALETMSTKDEVSAIGAVLEALGSSGDPAAEMAIRSRLEDDSYSVRLAAADALEALTGEPRSTAMIPDGEKRNVDWSVLAEVGARPRVVLETDLGDVVLELDAEQAPLSVQSFVRLVRDGAYDGVPFHRVVPFFVVQGGDIVRGDGFGSPGFHLRTEATRIPFRRGTLGMASAGRDTEGAQFFINHVLAPHLDGGYSAFGRVLSGQDVVDRIERWHLLRTARVE